GERRQYWTSVPSRFARRIAKRAHTRPRGTKITVRRASRRISSRRSPNDFPCRSEPRTILRDQEAGRESATKRTDSGSTCTGKSTLPKNVVTALRNQFTGSPLLK